VATSRLKEITIGAVLTALALIIPLYFGFLRILIPPFSATLASHVPVMLGMFVSPAVAVAVGLGSTLGFFTVLGPVIAARAFIHVIFGAIGAWMYRRGSSAITVLVVILFVHAIGEALAILPFGFPLYVPGEPLSAGSGLFIAVGTALHHIMDSVITLALLPLLWAARVFPRRSETQI